MMESAPQLCLQVYIMFRQWRFPWYTIVSNIFSLLSLAWGITALEKARLTMQEDTIGTIAIGAYFLSQLFFMLMRILAIAIFAYSTQLLIFLPVVLHVIFVFAYLHLFPPRANANSGLIRLACNSFPFIFHASRPIGLLWSSYSHPRYYIAYIIIGVESVLLSIISFILKSGESDNERTAVTIALSVVLGSLVLASILSGLYDYIWWVPSASNNNNVEGEGNGQNGQENAPYS